MPIKSVKITLIFIFWIFSSLANAQNEIEITMDESLSLFYERNLDLLIAQYNIDQARAEEIIAGAIPNPTISIQMLEIAHNPNSGSIAQGCNPTPGVSCGIAQYYSFSQLIEIAGKRGLRMEGASFGTKAAESDFKDAVRVFSNLIRNAYYDLLQAQKNLWLAQEISKHYEDINLINKQRLKIGDIAEADYLRVQIEAMKAQSDLDSSQALFEQAQAGFAQILRWPDKSMTFHAKEEWPTLKDIGQDKELEILFTKAFEIRPDLEADKLRLDQAAKELELARRLVYPDVTVNAGYARDPSNNNLNSFFVGLSVPTPLFYQYQGETDKSATKLNQAKLAVEQTQLNIKNDVVSTHSSWKSKNKIVNRFESGLLSDARVVRDSADVAFKKGASNVLDFIEAQRSYKNVMRDYYEAQINRSKAYFDLIKAIGLDTVKASMSLQTESELNGKNN
jgi:outer membrane protein, heavy metal efflux system